MRKYYIENYSFYKLLEDINSLPVGTPTLPYYYKRRYDYIDVYVVFLQDYPEFVDKFLSDVFSEKKNTQISVFFYRKPKDVRRSSLVVPICQILVDSDEFINCVLLPQVRTVGDLLNKLACKYTEINTALDNACKFDTQT